jgi:tetratricopeptide (TPR) repeat protein
MNRDGIASDLYQLGRVAYDAGRQAEAQSLLRASALLKPHFKTLELLGECCFQAGQLADAALFLAASVGIAPNQARARLLLAKVLSSIGDRRLARLQLVEALRVNPQYRAARDLLQQWSTTADDEDSGDESL